MLELAKQWISNGSARFKNIAVYARIGDFQAAMIQRLRPGKVIDTRRKARKNGVITDDFKNKKIFWLGLIAIFEMKWIEVN